MSNTQWKKSVVLLTGAACMAASASAQSLVTTSVNIIAADGMVAPGTGGATFGGSGNFDTPNLDASGAVFFRGRLIGTGVVTTNERGVFYGASNAGLNLVIRGGDPAPTLSGITLNTASAQGIGGTVRLSSNGRTFFGSSMSGTGVVTTNDTALFGGLPGSLVMFVREGDLAPSGGSTMSSGFNSPSSQPTGLNSSGRVLFQTALTGGDVSGTTNNSAWITGTPGALEWVQRKGDTVLGGAVVSALGFISQMNASGQVLHDETLSQTLGSTPATPANDKVLFVWTPGLGNQAIVREGDVAPDTGGATFNVASNSWSVNVGACSFNRDGQALIQATLQGGNVTGPDDDTGYFVCSTSGVKLAVREGDAAPGTDAFLNTMHSSLQFINNSGRIAFESALIGGTSTTANDTGIWAGAPGALELVVREGDPCPGLPGEFFGSTMGLFMMYNDAGQVFFTNSPTGGGGTSAYYGWTPGVGLTLIARIATDLVEVTPGVFKTLQSLSSTQFNNGDDSPQVFGPDGTLAMKLGFTDGTGAVATVKLPSAPYGYYCDPGQNGALSCPCSNPPASLGRGCENSDTTGGAKIVASGSPSLANDTLVFTTSGERAVSTSIVLTGTSKTNGSVFGQGVRCVGGSLKRLYVKVASAGSISVPGGGDPSISASHAAHFDTVNAGDHRYYMVYYRDPIVLGTCGATSTFNGTNALDVTWAP